jgi:hypothetical protein
MNTRGRSEAKSRLMLRDARGMYRMCTFSAFFAVSPVPPDPPGVTGLTCSFSKAAGHSVAEGVLCKQEVAGSSPAVSTEVIVGLLVCPRRSRLRRRRYGDISRGSNSRAAPRLYGADPLVVRPCRAA